MAGETCSRLEVLGTIVMVTCDSWTHAYSVFILVIELRVVQNH